MTISIESDPLSSRPCVGLGLQADCYIYDNVNRQFGVDEDDYARWERRLRLLRPGIGRIFVPTTEFNPSGDGQTYDWQSVEMQRQYRNLAVLKEAGATINLCMGPWTRKEIMKEGSHRVAIDLLEHLIREEGFDNIRWLTLFNEPDSFYSTGTPLAQWLQEKGFGRDAPFSDYVEKHKLTLDLLDQRGLADSVQLTIGDVVWPPTRRQEWLELLKKDFGDGPASYSFHHYIPEDQSLFEHPDSHPFRAPVLSEEIQGHRDAVGEKAQLICWEFNEHAWCGGTAGCGTGAYGVDHIGTFEVAVKHTRKTLAMLANAVDGVCHWCAGDMFYRSGLKQGVMNCGLWRYKWENWTPRPYYFYYAALMECFRPGCRVHRLEGLPEGMMALAAKTDETSTVAIINSSAEPKTLHLQADMARSRLRVMRSRLPRRPDTMSRETPEADTPLSHWEPLTAGAPLVIEPQELTLLR